MAPSGSICYHKITMKQKSITFRCSDRQNSRLCLELTRARRSRTDFLTAALECFLTYAEQSRIRKLNLFELVRDVDARHEGPSFEEQA